jgi:folate-binding protein YgfZ
VGACGLAACTGARGAGSGDDSGTAPGALDSTAFCMARDFARIQSLGLRETCGKTMLNEPVGTLSSPPRAKWGAVRVHGTEAVRFLQGQLSNDIDKLRADEPLYAGLHNPQGRVIALLRLFMLAPDDVLGVLPQELAAPVAARLAKFVLRAKAKVTDASTDSVFTSSSAFAELTAAERIAAGLPQVYAATSEQFVAQMLNLDVIGAISFTKGCYTGQEVIARAHYRGRVKRRMQRFRTSAPAQLAIGESGTLRDGRSFRVVEAVTLGDGRCEFLAVAPVARGEEEPSEDAASAAVTALLEAEQLNLPYELPA